MLFLDIRVAVGVCSCKHADMLICEYMNCCMDPLWMCVSLCACLCMCLRVSVEISVDYGCMWLHICACMQIANICVSDLEKETNAIFWTRVTPSKSFNQYIFFSDEKSAFCVALRISFTEMVLLNSSAERFSSSQRPWCLIQEFYCSASKCWGMIHEASQVKWTNLWSREDRFQCCRPQLEAGNAISIYSQGQVEVTLNAV